MAQYPFFFLKKFRNHVTKLNWNTHCMWRKFTIKYFRRYSLSLFLSLSIYYPVSDPWWIGKTNLLAIMLNHVFGHWSRIMLQLTSINQYNYWMKINSQLYQKPNCYGLTPVKLLVFLIESLSFVIGLFGNYFDWNMSSCELFRLISLLNVMSTIPTHTYMDKKTASWKSEN